MELNEATIIAIINILPTVAVSIAALMISRRQVRLEKNKAQRELFERFNTRFDNMNEELNDIHKGIFILKHKSEEQIIQDYLNLCSEEYLWYKMDLIDTYIWNNWLTGINYYLKSPLILDVFVKEQENSPNSYYGFFQCIDTLKLRASMK